MAKSKDRPSTIFRPDLDPHRWDSVQVAVSFSYRVPSLGSHRFNSSIERLRGRRLIGERQRRSAWDVERSVSISASSRATARARRLIASNVRAHASICSVGRHRTDFSPSEDCGRVPRLDRARYAVVSRAGLTRFTTSARTASGPSSSRLQRQALKFRVSFLRRLCLAGSGRARALFLGSYMHSLRSVATCCRSKSKLQV